LIAAIKAATPATIGPTRRAARKLDVADQVQGHTATPGATRSIPDRSAELGPPVGYPWRHGDQFGHCCRKRMVFVPSFDVTPTTMTPRAMALVMER